MRELIFYIMNKILFLLIFFTVHSYAQDTLTKNTDSLYLKGQADAIKYYRGYKTAGTFMFLSGIFIQVWGILPTGASADRLPKDKNLMYPNAELMKLPDYSKGYTDKALKIKKGKVWKNFFIGFAIGIAGDAVLFALLPKNLRF